MSRKILDRVCLICGDRASGFHFDVITCESCKSFFRRNALKNKNLKCFLGGECKIDVFNRTFCKKCRLNKCLNSGMKTQFILSDEQRKLRKVIIEENRRRKINNENNSKNIDWKTDSSTHFRSNDYSNGITCMESTFQIECCTRDRFVNCNDVNPTNSIEDPVVVIERPITDNKTFNELEANRLSELLNASKVMTDPSVSFGYQICNFWDAIRVMHKKLDIDIRKLVKMCKSLTGFRAVSESDQIVLLKFASIEIIIIRMIVCFDFQLENWNIITNSENSNLIKLELFKHKNTYENHKHFLHDIGQEWDSDPIIIDLVFKLFYCSNLIGHAYLNYYFYIQVDCDFTFQPESAETHESKLQQQIYMDLLQRYLLLKYESQIESKSRLFKILKSLTDLHILNEKIRLNCLQMDLNEIPLLKEICDRDALITQNCLN